MRRDERLLLLVMETLVLLGLFIGVPALLYLLAWSQDIPR